MTDCRGQQETGESTGQTTSNSFDPSKSIYANIEQLPQSKPDVIYANIEQHSQSASDNTPDNNNEAVIYSELQRKDDADGHAVAPSGDLYAQVQKR